MSFIFQQVIEKHPLSKLLKKPTGSSQGGTLSEECENGKSNEI